MRHGKDRPRMSAWGHFQVNAGVPSTAFFGIAVRAPWRDVPDSFGHHATCYNRLVHAPECSFDSELRIGGVAGRLQASESGHQSAIAPG